MSLYYAHHCYSVDENNALFSWRCLSNYNGHNPFQCTLNNPLNSRLTTIIGTKDVWNILLNEICYTQCMKIVSWNCNGALRKKLDSLKVLNGDIYIIQECEDPDRSNDFKYKEWAKYFCWIGARKDRGLGIFSKVDLGLKDLNWVANGFESFLPCSTNLGFNILGVWTKNNQIRSQAYIGQLWNYLKLNEKYLGNSAYIISGDFNSNAIWNKRYPKGNHSDVVKFLNNNELYSLYHAATGEEQGKESAPTFFMYRKNNKTYHLDYAFLSQTLLVKPNSFELGTRKNWLNISDHLPLSFILE